MPSHRAKLSDKAAIRATLQGDARQFDVLIDRHFGVVYAIALARLRDREMAEDLAQEVFLRAYLHLGNLDNPDQFGPWVGRVARNLSIDWLRRGQRRSQLLPMIPLDEHRGEIADPAGKGAHEAMVAKEESESLFREVMNLPAEEREVILLHFNENLSQREIADRLGISQATVSRQIKRALEDLRGALEQTLRREMAAFRPQRRMIARTGLLIVTVAALSGSAKAALAAAGPMGSFTSLSAGYSGSAAGAAGLFKILTTSVIAGGKLMTTTKGIIASVIAIVAIAGGVHFMNKQSHSETQSQRPSTTSATPASQTRRAVSPGEIEAMAALAPRDAAILVQVPNLTEFMDPYTEFFQSLGAPQRDWRQDFAPAWGLPAGDMEEGGIDLEGPMITAVALDFGTPSMVMHTNDPVRFAELCTRETAREGTHAGHRYWLFGQLINSEPVVGGVAEVDGNVLFVNGSQCEAVIQRALDNTTPTPLAGFLSERTDAPLNVAYDLAGMSQTYGPSVRAFLSQIEGLASGNQPGVSRSFIAILAGFFGDDVRELLALAPNVAPLYTALTPTADEIHVRVSFRMRQAVDAVPPATDPLTLGSQIPEGSMLALLCGAPGDRGAAIMTKFDTILAKFLVGMDPDALSALLELELGIIDPFKRGREEAVLALYPSEDGSALPRRVFIDRRGEDGESAQVVYESFTLSAGRSMRRMLGSEMPDLDYSNSSLQLPERVTIAGHEVCHFIHGGPGLMASGTSDAALMSRSPQLAMFGPVGEVDHWLAQVDDMVILTTEPEPDLMTQILQGRAEGIDDVPEGDMALRIGLGALFQWLSDRVVRVDPEEPTNEIPLSRIAQQFSDPSECIWIGVKTLAGGFDASITLPAAIFSWLPTITRVQIGY